MAVTTEGAGLFTSPSVIFLERRRALPLEQYSKNGRFHRYAKSRLYNLLSETNIYSCFHHHNILCSLKIFTYGIFILLTGGLKFHDISLY